ncbi:hypothetical protein PLICRDRAFT_89654 [Plicaturopsis crispa FD-325 SS-3]|nr:hypothetical protein PLICRDRAFT_89654 [Plicaturopsis crispa FD-325 SS-3]
MAKQKTLTPQEVYRERKIREEQERTALLPPGLINHGNTCFMNSVLQGLIATSLLRDLVLFRPLPPHMVSTHVAARRSPQLTNGHGVAGKDEREFVEGMPLGDTFVAVMQRAWVLQEQKRRESISPRDILSTIGRKHDQYLDFRQQDSHEFLRLLLDAMRMEEHDIIKKRQPPPPPEKSKKGRKHPEPTIPEDEKLVSFVDMIFGGRLTSLLVCQSCKHVSHTYEDFNDLSLSIKPEDYARERKRDRLRTFAKKLTKLPSAGPAISAPLEIQRSSSVPASPRDATDGFVGVEHEYPFHNATNDPRGRSVDFVGGEVSETDVEVEAKPVLVGGSDSAEEKGSTGEHVVFVEKPKDEQEKKKGKDDDGWVKLGRRISLGLGMSQDRRKSRSRERSKRHSSVAAPIEALKEGENGVSVSPKLSLQSPHSSPSIDGHKGKAFWENGPLSPRGSDKSRSRHREDSHPSVPPPVPPLPPPPASAVPRFFRPSSSGSTSSKPGRPVKPSAEESEFLRRILADITPASGRGFFKAPGHNDSTPSSALQIWSKMGGLPGIEECLRMFTAVENLDGENMVGCRRCWKIENGVYKPRDRAPSDCFQDSESEENEKSEEKPAATDALGPPLASSSGSVSSGSSAVLVDPPSDSSPSTPMPSRTTTKSPPQPLNLPDVPTHTREPNVTSYGGLPIPMISTTAPESPISPPLTAKPRIHSHSHSPNHPSHYPLNTMHSNLAGRSLLPYASGDSLSAPATNHRRARELDADSTGDSADESSDGAETDASGNTSYLSETSLASAPASPNASGERLPLSSPTFLSSPPSPVPPKIPRSKQVIMRPAYKRYLIATPPPVLVIHLKRFQQTGKASMISFAPPSGFKKLDDYISFPEDLDLAPFLAPKKEDFGLRKKRKGEESKRADERCMYRLYAVIVHIGNMLGGHYIAYAALPTPPASPATPEQSPKPDDTVPSTATRQWAYISDTVVRLATLDEVLKAKAYICMYERV